VKAPFVWFGGKRKVAPQVWQALGDVKNYVEPFAGSLAVLLGRPHDLGDDGLRRVETVNDADGYIANFWRALTADPDAVAHYCDWPVNETDLFARHLWLVNSGRSRLVNKSRG
jgi:DNA adenine methylase